MSRADGPATHPAAIDVDPDSGLMRIAWEDGHSSTYELAALRPFCPCAQCQGEMGVPGSVHAGTMFTAEQTTLVDLREVGRYALQPVWADGHQTGYFTFEQLRALCPCQECTSRQAP